MSAPTEEDLQKVREANERLRAEIAKTNSTRAEREAEASREVQYLQLSAENARLEAELANAKELAKVGTVKAGSEQVLASTKDQLAAAVAVAEAGVGPVDTNAESQPKNTTGAIRATEEKKDGGNS